MEATSLNLNTAWGGTQNNINDYQNCFLPQTYIPYIQTFYQPYYIQWETDRTGKAMRLIQTLMEKKLMKEPKTVGEFIEIVNEVSKII